MAGGRPTKYHELVKPRLKEIAEWRENGWTEDKIAKELGVSRTAMREYKKLYPEFLRTIKSGNAALIGRLKGALVKAAEGYQYPEIKKIYERNKETGKMEHVRTEETIKTAPPSVAAINLALKNFDRENWSNDPQLLELRRKELELKAKKQEDDDW